MKLSQFVLVATFVATFGALQLHAEKYSSYKLKKLTSQIVRDIFEQTKQKVGGYSKERTELAQLLWEKLEKRYTSMFHVQTLMTFKDKTKLSAEYAFAHPIHFAAALGDGDLMKKAADLLAREKVENPLRDYKGKTPLMGAVHNHCFELVSEIIKSWNVDVNAFTHSGKTALWKLVRDVRSDKDIDLVKALLERGAYVTLQTRPNKEKGRNGSSPLKAAEKMRLRALGGEKLDPKEVEKRPELLERYNNDENALKELAKRLEPIITVLKKHAEAELSNLETQKTIQRLQKDING